MKRLDDDDPTTMVTVGDDLTLSSVAPAPPPPPAGQLPKGMRIGDYVIEEKIGQGGMGSVYRALHPVIGKAAAIKVLEVGAGQYDVERFLDEARVVNQIGHPNIVDVFAFGETPDGRSYLVMEWLKGETLRKRLDRATMSLPELCDIVRPLTRALQAAHDKGVIHRDLKPDNVFLVDVPGEPAIVKLLDFGIAKPASTEHRVAKTATGAIVGTPLYIAPEQAKGREIDSAADVYALGGMLFEMLCRRPPFVADNAMEIVAKHLMEPAPRPSQFGSVPPALDDLVIAMLAKEPMQRPLLAAVTKVLDLVRDQPVPSLDDRATLAAARRPTEGSDINLLTYQPATSSDVAIPPYRPVLPASPQAAFPEEIRTPFPMRPTADPVIPSSRPISVGGPMTELDDRTPSPRRKWIIPVVVVLAAGAIAFAITSALGGDNLDHEQAADPAQTAPKPDPITVEPAPTPEAAKPEAAGPDSTKPDVVKPVTPTKPDTSKPDVMKPEASKPELARPTPTKPTKPTRLEPPFTNREPAKAEPPRAKLDPPKPRPVPQPAKRPPPRPTQQATPPRNPPPKPSPPKTGSDRIGDGVMEPGN